MISVMTEWRRKNPEKAKESRQRYEKENKDKLNEKRRAYRKENPEIVKNQWYWQYRMPLEEYEAKLEEQHHCCALCGKPSWECRRALAVDHDHETGKNRDLLCTGCNILVGLVEKRGFKIFEKIRAYIKRHKGT
jgi:hypothetical protein